MFVKALQIIKVWVLHLFKIRRCHWITFEKDGKKILTIVKIKGKDVKRYDFSINHLVNDKYEVTEETRRREREMFTRLNSK